LRLNQSVSVDYEWGQLKSAVVLLRVKSGKESQKADPECNNCF